MHLITPTLLNSFDYYFNFEAEPTEDDDGNVVSAKEKEAKVRQEFLQTLSREKFPPTEAMLKGIGFENAVRAYCEGQPAEHECVGAIGDICKGGMWQQVVKAELDGFLLYGRVDVMRQDTVIDIKFTGSYELGKFLKSAQHPIYLHCSGLPKFSYLISNGREWWREDYFNHAGNEQVVRDMIRNFTGYLENDPEAKELYYSRWGSK